MLEASDKQQELNKNMCEHKSMTIYQSYEDYAVCDSCGWHDWSTDNEEYERTGGSSLEHLKKKYPNAKVVNLLSIMRQWINQDCVQNASNGKTMTRCQIVLDYKPPCKHKFWKDRNPDVCLNCGKTELKLLRESLIKSLITKMN